MQSLPKEGDYVLATKYSDVMSKDQWAVGFFVGVLSQYAQDRYEVADNYGNLFRNNGFRKVKKISKERGEWLLDNKEDIERSNRSLWWWVKQNMEEIDKHNYICLMWK